MAVSLLVELKPHLIFSLQKFTIFNIVFTQVGDNFEIINGRIFFVELKPHLIFQNKITM